MLQCTRIARGVSSLCQSQGARANGLIIPPDTLVSYMRSVCLVERESDKYRKRLLREGPQQSKSVVVVIDKNCNRIERTIKAWKRVSCNSAYILYGEVGREMKI